MAKPLWSASKDEDPGRALLRGAIAGARGAYSFESWSIKPGEGKEPLENLLVGSHESSHDILNGTTAYGNLLMLLASLAARGPKPGGFEGLLKQLISRCLKVHESYATYMSLMGGLRRRDVILTRLAGNEEYLGYFRMADRIGAGLLSPSLRTHAVSAVAHYCMQIPEIGPILGRGLEHFRPSDLRDSQYPNARLVRAIGLVDGRTRIWEAAFDRARAQHDGLPGWDLLAGGEDIDPSHAEVLASHEASFHLSVACYEALAEVAASAGLEALGFNGHQAWTDEMIAQGESLSLDRSEMGSATGVVGIDVLDLHQDTQARKERYVLVDPPRPASIRLWSELGPSARARALSALAIEGTLMIVARRATAIERQYQLDARSRSLLRKMPGEAAFYLRGDLGRAGGASSHVMHFALNSPRELAQLLAKEGEGRRFLINVAASVLLTRGTRWFERWSETCAGTGRMTILADIPAWEDFGEEHWEKPIEFRLLEVYE